MANQQSTDQRLSTYELSFPTDLGTPEVLRWVHAITGTVHNRSSRKAEVATIVLELVATARGFTHRLRLPVERAGYIISQLRTHVPGIHANITYEPLDDRWTLDREYGMTNANYPLNVANPEAVTTQILASLQALSDDETVVIQTLVTPMPPQSVSSDRPVQSTRFNVWATMTGNTLAGADEVDARKKKLAEPNMRGVLRIAVQAGHEKRALHLIKQVEMAIAPIHTAHSRFKHRRRYVGDLGSDIALARVPMHLPIQLTATELVSLSAWPLGQPHVAGLPAGRTRHLPATEAIPRTGRVIGRSTMPGNERPIAISAEASLMHLQIVGGTGSGKTELAANLIAQNVANGDGVFVLDPQGKLFDLALDVIPPHRVQDVIAIDMRDASYPVGFNILQGNPQVVATNLQRLFDSFEPHGARGIRVPQTLYHAVLTLMLSKNASQAMTFADLTPLCIPRSHQVAFSDNLIRGVAHIDELAAFWQDVENMSHTQREQFFGPLMARAWQINNRRQLRNTFGQSTSGFNLRQAIQSKKVVLVNMAGQGDDIEGLIGSIFFNALWGEIKADAAAGNGPLYFYADEFHRFMRQPISQDDLFTQARGKGLAATIMYQHANQLDRDLQATVANNVRSPLIFQALGDEARHFARQFGPKVSESDFEHLRRFEAIMRVMTADGVSSPVTLSTLPLKTRYGLANDVIQASRARYARPVAEVDAEIEARRGVGNSNSSNPRPRVGKKRWI